MIRIALSLAIAFLFFCTNSQAQYFQGPRGGCYTFNSNGNKKYVERSLCAETSASKTAKKIATEDLAAGRANLVSKSRITSFSTSKDYIRGPRGGCYYVSSGGNKKYVERSLCD